MKHFVLLCAAGFLFAGCENRYADSPVLDGFDPAEETQDVSAAPAPAADLATPADTGQH